MGHDGYLNFDTRVDNTGFQAGITALGSIAAAAVATVGVSVAALSAGAVKVGSDFEAGMSKVAAVSGASAESMVLLTAKAEEMGAVTKFTATQSAEALNFMAQAGWKTEQMLSGIDGVMALAAASGEDLASVSDIVTDSLTAFGLAAADCSRFTDVLAMAANASNTDVAKLGATFKYVAPVAGAMGYTIEDTAVAIGLMANAGIKAEMAGTSLRQLFTRLVKPTDDVAEIMEILQLEITNIDGSIKPLSTTLEDLRGKFSSLTDAQKAEYAAILAGQEGMSGLLSIVNASEQDFQSLTEQINNSAGTAQEMADIMQDNLQGQLTILGSSLEAVGITAFKKFAEPMKNAVKSAIEDVNGLNSSMADGKLSASIDKIAASFAMAATKLAAFAADTAIPTLIDTFIWIIDNGNTVLTVIGGIAAAMAMQKVAPGIEMIAKAWQGATFVLNDYSAAVAVNNAVTQSGKKASVALASGMSGLQLVVGLLTHKIKASTAAQVVGAAAAKTFTAAIAKNPVGAVLTAVVALGTVVKLFADNAFKASKQVKELNKELEQLKESTEEERIETEAECRILEQKGKRYDELRQKVGRTVGEEKEIKAISLELQNILPEGTKILGEQAGQYNDLSFAIAKTTAEMRTQTTLKAEKSIYEEEIKQIVELEKELGNAQKKRDDYADENAWKMYIPGAGLVNSINYLGAETGLQDIEKRLEMLRESTKGYEEKAVTSYQNVGDAAGDSAEKATASAAALEESLESLKKRKTLGKITEREYYSGAESLLNANNEHEMGEYTSLWADIYAYKKTLDEKSAEDAEKPLKESLEGLKKEKALGIIAEEEYYDRSEKLLNAHNEGEMGEYTDLWADIISGRKSLNDRLLSEQEQSNAALLADQNSHNKKSISDWEKGLDGVVSASQKAFEDIQDRKNNLADKLQNFGGMFEKEEDMFYISDISSQISQMEEYRNALEEFRDLGASDGFMSEFMSMDVGDALDFSAALGSGDTAGYLKSWEEKNSLADQISSEFYAGEVNIVQEEFTDKITEQLAQMPEIAGRLGQDTAAEFVAGMKLKTSEIDGLFAKMRGAVASQMGKIGAGINVIHSGGDSAVENAEKSQKTRVLQPIQLKLDGKTIGETVVEYINGESYQSGQGVIKN